MTAWTPLDIFFRWMHVATACIVVGCAFFIRFLLPHGLRLLDAEPRHAVLLKTRRAFKMVVHSGILLFLISGIYNAVRNWHTYTLWPGVAHGLFGLHLLLGLIIFTISLTMLAGLEPQTNHANWMKWNVVLMLITILVASVLKWAREHALQHVQSRRAVASQVTRQ